MHAYFAYGSNLDPVQMARRCPDSRFRCRARLPRHQLCFPLPCERWGGGVAGIQACPERDVHGVVYDVSDADLASLDRYEDIAGGDYTRERITVICEAGEPLEVWTYFAIPYPAGSPLPSRRYLEAILRGAAHHGLPAPYLAHLRGLPTCD